MSTFVLPHAETPALRPDLRLVTGTLHDLNDFAAAGSHGDWYFSPSDPLLTPFHSPRPSKGVASPLSPLLSGWASASQILTARESDMHLPQRHSQPKVEPLLEEELVHHHSNPGGIVGDQSAQGLPPMYNGQKHNSPVASQDAQPSHPHTIAATSPSSSHSHQEANHQHQNSADCTQCSKSRSMPPSSFPHAVMRHMQPSPSASPDEFDDHKRDELTSSVPRKKCGHCGKTRRTGRTASQDSTKGESTKAGLEIPTIKTNGLLLRPEDEPMSASPARQADVLHVTKRPGAILPAPVDGTGRKNTAPKRTSSISRIIRALSFSRRRSERRTTPLSPTPDGSHNPRSHGDTATEKTTLAPVRPDSPLSFLEQPKEDDAFELKDMRPRLSSHNRQSSWTKSDDQSERLPIAERSKYTRSQSAQVTSKDHLTVPAPVEDPTYFGITPDQRPGVTRFKSLRSGVNRTRSQMQRTASQIGRSRSLRRLGSVKKVPQLWYRNDMLFDGSGQDYEHGEYHTY